MSTANSIASTRQIEISDWKPYVKNTLQGFFTATFPSGMVLHEVMLHQKNERRWISLPAREWINQQGVKQYVQWIDFTDKPTRERFQEQVLVALDNHLNNLK